jgi:D-glycero-alpha-D-manno-heptose-7-phosphate kinase
MIISRTPFRISFFGGGTDYPAWYEENGGSVISVSINKYCFITLRYLPQFFEYKHRIRYVHREEVNDIEQIKHPSVRECLKFVGINEGIDIVHHADLPAQSGLGTSSTFTVCLLHALYTLKHYMPTKRELAMNAIEVEQKWIKEDVGSQDQTAAAFGGLNHISFGGSSIIDVKPMVIEPKIVDKLSNNLLLFFTGFTRNAATIAKAQIDAIQKKEINLNDMMQITEEAKNILLYNNDDLDELGRLLHEQWLIKRSLTPYVSSDLIDKIYERGLSAGAIGGKLLGAGGGGFIMFYADQELHNKIKNELSDLLHVPIRFDHSGSQIVYYSHSN